MYVHTFVKPCDSNTVLTSLVSVFPILYDRPSSSVGTRGEGTYPYTELNAVTMVVTLKNTLYQGGRIHSTYVHIQYKLVDKLKTE